MPYKTPEKRRLAWRRWYEKNGGKNPERSNPITRLAVRTREQVAAALGVSIETVRLDEKSAIEKLRRHPEAFEGWIDARHGCADLISRGPYGHRIAGLSESE